MNCRRVRHLITPYLDHHLTGQQMLDLQQHFDRCVPCAEEMRSIRRIKMLLRSLHPQVPSGVLPAYIGSRLAGAGPRKFHSDSAAVSAPRGRRLATALGLSCLALFIVAAPFAPAPYDAARLSHAAPEFSASALRYSPAVFSEASLVNLRPDSLRPAELSSLTVMRLLPRQADAAAQERLLPTQSFQSQIQTQRTIAEASLSDTAQNYVPGTVTLADYPSR